MRKKFSLVMAFVIALMSFFIGFGKTDLVKADTVNPDVHYDDVLVGTHNLNNTSANSAQVGDTIKEPEIGWNRYDFSNTNINYSGQYDKLVNGDTTTEYKGTYTRSYTGNSTQFFIYGKKIRIIQPIHSSYPSLAGCNEQIVGDGVVLNTIATILPGNAFNTKIEAISFEYTFNTNGLHNIQINHVNPTSGDDYLYELDAIDTDGKLISQNDIPKLNPVLTVDSSVLNTIFTNTVPVTGIALNQSGISSVKYSIDGGAFYNTQFGIARADVAANYPAYTATNNGGYNVTLSANNYTVGDHILKIQSIGIDGTIQELILYLHVYNSTVVVTNVPFSGPAIEYQAHVQNIGWQNWVDSGNVAGTTGQSLRMEAIRIRFKAPYNNDHNLHIMYRAHVANLGWLPWVKDGEVAGTTGQSLRMEALEIKIVDNNGVVRSDYNLSYQAHVQDIGWQNLVYTGQTAGTTGQSLRMEAVIINASKK
ncbi:MAG: Ig-like domain-containing protein [Bacillota bacterium]|nr:Ig-like domain-containing protein [Bacillota bacterium]